MREQNLPNARQPANEHRRVLAVCSLFFSRYSCLSRVKSRISFSFYKNLRGIVRKSEVRKSANSVVTESSSRVTERTVRQRFYPK